MYSFLLGFIGGIFTILSFPPFEFHYLIWFFPVFIYHVYFKKGSLLSALLGWGLIFFTFSFLNLPFDTFIVFLTASISQIAIFALILDRILRSKCSPSFYVFLPCAWVFFEFLQDRGFLGIPFHFLKHLSTPWLSLGIVLYSHPLSFIASILGVWGLSFIILVVGGILHRLIVLKRIVSLSFVFSVLISLSFLPQPEYESGMNIKVGLVQPYIGREQAYSFTAALSRSFRLSGLLFHQRSLDIIVWPLSYINPRSSGVSLNDYISNFAEEYRCYVIVGFGDDNISVFSSDGEEKRSLKALFILPRKENLLSSYTAQSLESNLIETENFSFAVVRGLDVGHSFLLRKLANKGANFFVSIVDDPLANILKANAIIRALETGLYLVFSSNSGPSFLASQKGRVKETLPFTQSTLFGEMSKGSSKTLFVKVGYYWVFLLVILLFIDYLLKLRYSRFYTLYFFFYLLYLF
ncbi:MAG: hypothetical protein N3C62_04510 [Synergistetes bacterium]|nr:hypothetical protein [Synergistota bacterium]